MALSGTWTPDVIWLCARTPETPIGNIYHWDLIVVHVYFAESHKSKQVHFVPSSINPCLSTVSSSSSLFSRPPFISLWAVVDSYECYSERGCSIPRPREKCWWVREKEKSIQGFRSWKWWPYQYVSFYTRFSVSLTIIFRGSCRYEHSSYRHNPIFLMSSLSHVIDRIKGGGLVR